MNALCDQLVPTLKSNGAMRVEARIMPQQARLDGGVKNSYFKPYFA